MISFCRDRAHRFVARCRQVDLRFLSRDEEDFFKQSLEHQLVVASSVVYLLALFTFVALGDLYDADRSFAFPINDPRSFRSWMGFFALCFVPLLSLSLTYFRQRISYLVKINLEILVTFVSTCISVCIIFRSGWIAAQLYGEDPDLVFDRDMRAGEGNVALTVDAINTAVCLFVPVRIHFKSITTVVGVASFSVVASVIGSPFPKMLRLNIFLLVSLTLCALWGAWKNERVARQNFLAQQMLKRSHRDQDILLAEKGAFEMLVSMLCDATLWLDEDGSTVLKCDTRFDMLMGTSMKDKSLSSCFADEEFERVRTTLKKVVDMPALVPTSINPAHSESHISADCLIVRRVSNRTAHADQNETKQPSFLLGVRISGQLPSSSVVVEDNMKAYDKVQALDMISKIEANKTQAEKAADNFARHEELSSALETMETTSTGHMFRVFQQEGGAWDDEAECDQRLAEISRLGHREGWLFDRKDVRLKPSEILGWGSFGIVAAAVLHGSQVAVKVPKKGEDRLLAKHLVSVANELRVLRHVRHPNIIVFFGAYIDDASRELCLILERIVGIQLGVFVERLKAGVQVAVRWQLVLDIACGLRYLHAQRPAIVHGDLKAGNVMVESYGPRAKLLDFGLARVLTKGAQPMGGSLKWMAPEVMLVPKVRPRASTDVFSFGRILYFTFSGKQPLGNLDKDTILELTRSGRTMPLEWPKDMPLRSLCLDLCTRTSNIHQDLRPPMQELHIEISGWQHDELQSHVSILPIQAVDDDPRQHEISRVRSELSNTLSSTSSTSGHNTNVGHKGKKDGHKASDSLDLVLTNKVLTQRASRLQMLVMVAKHFNIQFAGYCCPFHAVAADMYSLICELRRSPCYPSFMPHTQWQCARCGTLDSQAPCGICSRSSMETIDEEPSDFFAKCLSL